MAPTTDVRVLGLSDGRLAEIKLRLLDLPSSAWASSGTRVERRSGHAQGELVGEFTSAAAAAFCAAAPIDVDLLVREVEIQREHVAKLKQDMASANRAALEARAECGQWRDKVTEMRSAWRAVRDAMEGRR